MRGSHAASKSSMEEIVGIHLAIKKQKSAICIGALGLTSAIVISKALYTAYFDEVPPFLIRAMKAWWAWRRMPST